MPIQRRTTATVPDATSYAEPQDDGFDDENAEPEVVVETLGGWDNAKKIAEETKSGTYTDEFKITEETQLIAFIPGKIPFDVYKQHWINRKGKRSFVCLGAGCPLDEKAGDVPSGKYAFAIVHFVIPKDPAESVETKPALLIAGVRLMETLQAIDLDKRRGPLASRFFAISKAGKEMSTSYTVSPVKARDLPDDWGIATDDAERELAAIKLSDVKPVSRTSLADLNSIAREILDR